MIKRTIKTLFLSVTIMALMSSCYTYTTIVGDGPQGNRETTAWNHYLIYGLAPVGVSDPQDLAGDASDYSVTTKISFVNGLVAALTFSIYTPTTTIVTR